MKFGFATALLNAHYFERGRNGMAGTLCTFAAFAGYTGSIDNRNARLKLNRTSLRADWINKRCEGTSVDFRDILAADFIAFLRSEIDAKRSNKYEPTWHPETLCYRGRLSGPIEAFSRATSAAYFNQLKMLLAVDSADELREIIPTIDPPRYNHSRLAIADTANAAALASKR